MIVEDSKGQALSVIAEPWAYDAHGVEVPTWFEIEDGVVLQYVDHLSRDFAYPVVADPVWFIPVIAVGGRLLLQAVTAGTRAAATRVVTSAGTTLARVRSFTNSNKRHNFIV